jgi:hypothetical protein
LGWIGAQHPEPPLIQIGQFATAFYFLFFLVIVPIVGIIENTLFDLGITTQIKSKNSPLPVRKRGKINN